MLRLIGDIIFGIGWIVGSIKWHLGIVSEIPEKYRRGDNFGQGEQGDRS